MKIAYEWVIDTLDAHEDIVDVTHTETLGAALRIAAEIRAEGQRAEVGLVRDAGDEVDGLQDRQWAYIEDGKLPGEFDGGAKVPARLRREVENTLKEASCQD